MTPISVTGRRTRSRNLRAIETHLRVVWRINRLRQSNGTSSNAQRCWTSQHICLWHWRCSASRSAVLTAERRGRALGAIESWMVRRLLCRLTTKNYNRIFLDLIELVDEEPALADDVIVDHLQRLDGDSQRWPTDADLDAVVPTVRFYGWLTQARVVMVLKAVENHWRTAKSEERLNAGILTIEHVMPQSWTEFWPLPHEPTPDRIAGRNAAVQTLGNLTLATNKLNPSMSNSAWPVKQKALNEHTACCCSTAGWLSRALTLGTSVGSRFGRSYSCADALQGDLVPAGVGHNAVSLLDGPANPRRPGQHR